MPVARLVPDPPTPVIRLQSSTSDEKYGKQGGKTASAAMHKLRDRKNTPNWNTLDENVRDVAKMKCPEKQERLIRQNCLSQNYVENVQFGREI